MICAAILDAGLGIAVKMTATAGLAAPDPASSDSCPSWVSSTRTRSAVWARSPKMMASRSGASFRSSSMGPDDRRRLEQICKRCCEVCNCYIRLEALTGSWTFWSSEAIWGSIVRLSRLRLRGHCPRGLACRSRHPPPGRTRPPEAERRHRAGDREGPARLLGDALRPRGDAGGPVERRLRRALCCHGGTRASRSARRKRCCRSIEMFRDGTGSHVKLRGPPRLRHKKSRKTVRGRSPCCRIGSAFVDESTDHQQHGPRGGVAMATGRRP